MDRARSRSSRLLLRGVVAVLLGVATAALAWWRLGSVTRSTVWAEDGGIFLRERDALGPVASLLHPYAGYLHLVPRLLVDAGRALPVEQYAHVVSAGACIVVGAVASTVFLLARDVVPSPILRALLAAVPALLPLAPYEVLGNASNLHWTMLFAAPWLFSYRARSWWGAVVVALATVPVVLTELQTVIFLPLLLLAFLPLRGAGRSGDGSARAWPRALPLAVVALGGGAAQVGAALTDHRLGEPGSPAFPDVVAGYLLQPFAGVWNPDVGATVRLVVAHGWAVLVVPAAFLLAALLLALVVADHRTRWTAVALTAGSGGVWWAALLANADATQAWAHPVAALAAFPPQRYAAASGMLLVAAALVAAGALLRGSAERSGPTDRTGGAPRLVRAFTGWAVVGLVLVAVVGNVAPGPTRRDAGPVWATQVPAAAASCVGDPTRTATLGKVPWNADVVCSWLLGR